MKKLLFILLCISISSYAQVVQDVEKTNYQVTGTAHLTASRSITLKPLTWIKAGSTFTAKIINDPYIPLNLSNENYVLTRSFQTETKTGTVSNREDVVEQITYFDGLGRAKQSIAIQQSPTKEDIVTHIAYDELGRQNEEYLPYAVTSNNGGIISGAELGTKNYYKTQYAADFPGVTDVNLINAYSKKEFDNSPLNRVLKQAAPGKAWELGGGHEIEFDYQTNSAADAVKLFKATTTVNGNVYTPALSTTSSNYLAGELYKTVTRDENHSGSTKDHTTEEFKNKEGQVVLKRTYNNNVAHDTYYVYDDYGNLTFVLPPKVSTADGSVSTTELSELCYQYKYDHRNRLVEKKIPGKGEEYIVYDNLDRPVLTQDAKQKPNKKWLFTKYDALGRVINTGIYTHSTISSQPAMQSYFNTNSSTVTTGEVLTINYYDTYPSVPSELSAPSNVYSKAVTTNTQGLATVSKVKVLNTNNWITTVTYYDAKARPVFVASKNDYLGTTDIVESKLDFVGKVLETKATHKKGSSEIVTIDVFSYDHAGRMTKQTNKINNQTAETIVENTYDKLGQLKNKKVGAGLQKVDYAYNVRGWLKNINQDSDANDNDLFNFSLKYNNPTMGTALFNGNIAQTNWNSLSVNTGSTVSNQYTYSYDALNRITHAVGSNTSNYNLGHVNIPVTYDKNGNITRLYRYGHTNTGATSFGAMDNLYYTYDAGNKLLKVTDIANKTHGFKDGTNTGNDYTYDANGNMIADANKGITNITYNHLNLPTRVTIGGQHIDYTYDASGSKLRKTVSGITTDYAGNHIYKNGALEFFNHSEGYVKPVISSGSTAISSFEYVYQYKDHLGNVRLSYTDNNKDGVITASSEIIEESNYYPFGLKHKGYNNITNSLGNSTAQKYMFNQGTSSKNFQGKKGKSFKVERQEELGLKLDMTKFRMYDYALGRFTSIDPLADANPQESWTPYQYAYNSPAQYNDPYGDCPWCWGAVIGGVAEYLGQVAVNLSNGDSWDDAMWYNVDGADIVLSTVEGALTGGASTLKRVGITLGSEVAKASVDYKLNGESDVIYTKGSKKKTNTAIVDVITGTIGAEIGGKVNRVLDKSSSVKALKTAKSKVLATSKNLDKAINVVKNGARTTKAKTTSEAFNAFNKAKKGQDVTRILYMMVGKKSETGISALEGFLTTKTVDETRK
ncbi:DUF6443 domain-containing protein [Tenacibaculum halocynthiae]|uniref:DUF6443 domain-containing protein n=1 Tax=Tenacibaculum halocynthiae TaxID=1254437 RepID=UPI003895CA2F